MYRILEVDGIFRAWICKDNKADKYGEPKEWKKLKDAKDWAERRLYGGMSHKYIIFKLLPDGKWQEVKHYPKGEALR